MSADSSGPAVDGKWSLILRIGHEARSYSPLSHDVEYSDVRCGFFRGSLPHFDGDMSPNARWSVVVAQDSTYWSGTCG